MTDKKPDEPLLDPEEGTELTDINATVDDGAAPDGANPEFTQS